MEFDSFKVNSIKQSVSNPVWIVFFITYIHIGDSPLEVNLLAKFENINLLEGSNQTFSRSNDKNSPDKDIFVGVI